MAKKKNLIPLILLGIGAGVGGYFYYTRVMKPKQDAKKPLNLTPLPKPTVMAGALTQSFIDAGKKKKGNKFTSGQIVSIPRYLSPGATMSKFKTKPKTLSGFMTKPMPKISPFSKSSPIIYSR